MTFILYILDIWSTDDVNQACGIKLQLWKRYENAAPTNSLLAELEEKQLFEISNLVHIIADKVGNVNVLLLVLTM